MDSEILCVCEWSSRTSKVSVRKLEQCAVKSKKDSGNSFNSQACLMCAGVNGIFNNLHLFSNLHETFPCVYS